MNDAVLTSQEQDFPRWYQEVIAKAELADNGPVRGTMVIRPYGYAIWERIQAELDSRIKAAGVPNAYFPLFIPESYLHRESEHVEGFSPELAVVTHGGGKQLEEPVVVRPTSETIINAYFAKWIQSHRDLPLLVNQWANVVRWELRPRLFLRTTEFLWQEGHTAHATQDEARDFALSILHDVYEDLMVEMMAVPVFTGRKTPRERFPGADESWTCEGMMRDGKALQMGTSHELGQRFAAMFGTTFQSETGELEHPWQTSWGVSTRLIGAVIMAHGDDRGLRIPPRLAPVQVVVLAARAGEGVSEAASAIASELETAGVRVALDDRMDVSYGRRVTGWELKGVPLRVELGPRDLAASSAMVVSRFDGAREQVAFTGLAASVASLLETMQRRMLDEARERRDATVDEAASVEELLAAAKEVQGARLARQVGSQAGQDDSEVTARGSTARFARVPYGALRQAGEAELAAVGLSVRCLTAEDGGLPVGLAEGDCIALVAKAY